MWTAENRSNYERSAARYPSDVTDEEWALIEPHLPPEREQRASSNTSLLGASVVKKRNHQKDHPPKWNPGNSERGKVVGTAKHGKGFSAPRSPSKTPKKQRTGRTLKENA